jgi:dTDP-glucose 4,6-dehydratase
VTLWEGRRVLVTGAGGFIGGHLATALNREGARVRALCRYTSRRDRGTLDWFGETDAGGIEVVFGDLRDVESVQQAVRGSEVVFHLGAQIAIPYSYVNPRDFVETNVAGALNVAQAALDSGAARVVHVSSSEVYGEAESWPITERHRMAPRSPYAASKAGADLLMQSLERAHGLPVVIARPFNTYGPHQSARAVIPTIITQLLAGGSVRLGSLEPRRDLTFVTDTVSGLLALAGDERLIGSVLQLGSGKDISIGELATLIGELMGREVPIEPDSDRVRPSGSEVPRLLCDHTAATERTGWEPRVDLRSGLRQTIAWIEANQLRYRSREYAL